MQVAQVYPLLARVGDDKVVITRPDLAPKSLLYCAECGEIAGFLMVSGTLDTPDAQLCAYCREHAHAATPADKKFLMFWGST